MEYFTGDFLSDTPEQVYPSKYIDTYYMVYHYLKVTLITTLQVHMTHFRNKLAVILVDSELNDDGMRNRYLEDEDKRSPKKLKTSNPSSQVDLTSQSFLHLSRGGAENKHPLSVHIMPTDQRKLVDELCKHIMSIEDAKCLE